MSPSRRLTVTGTPAARSAPDSRTLWEIGTKSPAVCMSSIGASPFEACVAEVASSSLAWHSWSAGTSGEHWSSSVTARRSFCWLGVAAGSPPSR